MVLIGVGFRSDTLPYPPKSQFSDAAISRYPDALHFRRTLLEDHTIPLWNPHLMGGQPFAANPGTKVWYPLTWLLLVWQPALHINLMTAFHLWLGAAGMWYWSRRTGLTSLPAALASLGYLLAPKLMAHAGAGHLDLLIAVAWLPWLLCALQSVLMEAASPSRIIGLAFAAAMIFIGAIQLTPFVYGLGAVYGLSLVWKSCVQRGRFLHWLKSLMPPGILMVGFTAVQWLPLWELREAVSRGDLREQDAAIFSLKPGQWVGMLIGDHGGNAETITYVGISILILALLGLILRPRQNRLWWGVVLFAALYALGEHFLLWMGLVRVVPPLLLLRVPSRIWFLVAFLMPYLAGWGLQAVLEKPPDSPRARLGIVGLIGLGASCSLGSLVMLRETEIEMTALLGLFAFPLTAVLIALVIFRKIESRSAAIAFLILVAADCLWIDRNLIEGRGDWLNPQPPEIIAHLSDSGARIYTPDYAIPQQDTAYWGIARFDGVDPFQISSFIEASVLATGVPREGYSTTVPAVVVMADDPDSQAYQFAPMDARLLGEWGVEWVITGYEISIEGLELRQRNDGLYFYENTFAWSGQAQLQWKGPNRLTKIPNDDEHVYRVTQAPSWDRDDSPGWGDVDSTTYPYPTPPRYTYRPRRVYGGLIITGLTYLAAAVWVVGSRRRAW
jgi:hypothetical protein